MGLFNRKPQPSVAPPRSSKPSQRPSAKPVPSNSQAITTTEAKPIKQIYGHAKAADEQSAETLTLVREAFAPTPTENSQLAEVKSLLKDIVDKLTSIEGRLSA